jgi:hypothetical protein
MRRIRLIRLMLMSRAELAAKKEEQRIEVRVELRYDSSGLMMESGLIGQELTSVDTERPKQVGRDSMDQ